MNICYGRKTFYDTVPKLEWLFRDKQSKLFGLFLSYKEKSFITLAPGHQARLAMDIHSKLL
jgi:hypothetical protein